MTASLKTIQSFSENTKRLLLFSDQQLPDLQTQNLMENGFSVLHWKKSDDLVAEISSRRPYAIILDVKFCQNQGVALRLLLQKINPLLGATPVFLINASNINYLELISSGLVYAVLKRDNAIEKLGSALIRYQQLYKKHRDHALMRFGVSLPCLVKKLGSSGLIQGYIRDLSPKGMRIDLELKPEDWSTGDEIRFSFSKSMKQEGSHYLDGFGQLRWSRLEEEKPGLKKVRVGVQFSQLPEPTLYGVLDIVKAARSAQI